MKILLYSITFLMAFCSLTYEFIIATSLSHALGEGIYIYPACLGMFVFSMALGNLICLKLKDKLFLFWVEIALVLLGSVSVFLIKFSQIITPWGAVLNGFWFSLLIGVFTGMELPLLFELAGEKYGQGKTIRKIILMDYLASLFASLLFALFFAPLLGPLRTAVMVAFLNFIILILLVFLLRKELSVKWVLGFVIFFPFYFITIFYNLEKIENKFEFVRFLDTKRFKKNKVNLNHSYVKNSIKFIKKELK